MIAGKTKECIVNWIIKSALVICLAILYLRYIPQLNCITIVGDEFGYWANAAEILGYNWSDIASLNPYYSFGYSLLLLPVLALFETVIAYKLAIILNVFFVIASFELINRFLTNLTKSINIRIIYFISFVISISPNLYFQTLTTQAECFLFFLFCLIVYTFQKLVSRFTFGRFILFNILLFFLYSVHMRNVGIVIAGVIAEIILVSVIEKDKKVKSCCVLIILACLIIFFVGTEVIKNYLIENLYQANEIAQINTYTGQISKIKYIFSKEGIYNLFVSFIGKMFYFGAATFLIGYLGLYKLAVQIIVKLKNKKYDILNIFILLSILSQILIDAVYMVYPADRLDVLVYGRYFEHTIGPAMGVGFLSMVEHFSSTKKASRFKLVEYIYISFFFIVCILITYIAAEKLELARFFPGNAVAIVKLGGETDTLKSENLIYLAGLTALSLYILLLIFFNFKYKVMTYIGFICCGLLWLQNGDYVVKNATIMNQNKINEVAAVVNNMPDNYGIYFVNENVGEFNTIDYVQFLKNETSIKVIESNEIESISEKAYIITYLETPMSEQLKKQCEMYYTTPFMNIYDYY